MGKVIEVDFNYDKKYQVKFKARGQILFNRYDGPVKVDDDGTVTVYVQAFSQIHAKRKVEDIFDVMRFVD